VVTPEDRNFESEGEAIEAGLKQTMAVYRFRDATLVEEKKGDLGSALQNLYRELERERKN
jgi:hypothetical protein